ncbi:(S)-benzoin forming benzil reductase [Metabacillus sp. RGM 3146]|uniref:(S)-benzoin forming benzil reductase n=1 Tax=Metabacillus sp. RGM 3146 TaxID=3401092 RepID=UPI003B9CA996
MNVYIITGTSRGLGESIAEALLEENNHLICISRKANEKLENKAREKNAKFDYVEFDLMHTDEIEGLMENIFSLINLKHTDSIFLVNNAGMVQPVGPVGKTAAKDISMSAQINLIAPMILSSCFIRHTSSASIEKRIMNISSGAGRKPYFGWSSYCSGKAGLDHFTRVAAEETKDQQYGVKLISIAPGIIDTGMQQEIRSSSKEDFQLLDKFIDYKKNGDLASAAETADKLIRVLHSSDFGLEDPIMDVRHL